VLRENQGEQSKLTANCDIKSFTVRTVSAHEAGNTLTPVDGPVVDAYASVDTRIWHTKTTGRPTAAAASTRINGSE